MGGAQDSGQGLLLVGLGLQIPSCSMQGECPAYCTMSLVRGLLLTLLEGRTGKAGNLALCGGD